MLALRLKPEIENRLTALALKTGRTKTFYATKAIEQQLDDMEDYYLAEEAYKEWVAGGSKTVSLEEVKKHCSL
ncbi:MAG: TraY domain-containing protein [Treponema sp.]|nr:TraY domain-containing protein [Treponema sp.]